MNILHCNFNLNRIWALSKSNRHLSKQCCTGIMLISKIFERPYEQSCPKCGIISLKIVEHILLDCVNLNDKRDKLWTTLFNKFGIKLFKILMSMSSRNQLIHMFSGMNFFLDNSLSDMFLRICIKKFHSFWFW